MEVKNEIANFIWWVIPGKLMGVRRPENQEEVVFLKSLGVGGIVTLLDDQVGQNLYEEMSMDFFWAPVKGGTAPTKDQVTEAAEFIKFQNEKGSSVAVHCNNGRKRTGTMLAAQLILGSLSAEEAIELIGNLNPEAKLHEQQKDFLKSFALENS